MVAMSLNAEPKIFIVLPAYNAEKTLMRTVNEIPEYYQKNVLLVDDGSSDKTVEIAEQAGLQVISHKKNMGYGANQKTCYKNALMQGADIVVMLHPDHQYDAKIIPKMITPIIRGEADAVFGSRMLGGHPTENGMPAYKYYANIILTAIANIVFKRYLSEIHSGFRAYSRKYLELIQYESNSNNFVFDTEIIAQGMACNLFFQEVPIETRYFPEASSINFIHSIGYGFGVLRVLFQFSLHTNGIIRKKSFLPKEISPKNN